LVISFSQKGIDTAVFSGRFFSWLGKFSFSVYLTHHFYSTRLTTVFPKYSDKRLLAVYYGVSILTALVVMGLSDLIRKHGSKLKLKRLFVRPTTE
jgi:peptidoglycan/LPS O-acetylase OafA/YrhL